MEKFKVVKPTTVMPQVKGAGPSYGEGDVFEVYMANRKHHDFNRSWVAEQLKEGVIELVKEPKKEKPKKVEGV